MEKIVRVSCLLPVGTVVKANNKAILAMDALDEIVERAFGAGFARLPLRTAEAEVRSNLGITLELEVSMDAKDEVGRALFQMAKELLE